MKMTVRETEAVKQFAKTVEKHSLYNVVVLTFEGFDMEALRLAAERGNGGDVVAYIREVTEAALQNDLDAIRHDYRKRKGGAK